MDIKVFQICPLHCQEPAVEVANEEVKEKEKELKAGGEAKEGRKRRKRRVEKEERRERRRVAAPSRHCELLRT
eukprot:g3182.t2